MSTERFVERPHGFQNPQKVIPPDVAQAAELAVESSSLFPFSLSPFPFLTLLPQKQRYRNAKRGYAPTRIERCGAIEERDERGILAGR